MNDDELISGECEREGKEHGEPYVSGWWLEPVPGALGLSGYKRKRYAGCPYFYWRWLDIGGGGPVMPATVNDPIPGLQLAAWRGKAVNVRRVYPKDDDASSS